MQFSPLSSDITTLDLSTSPLPPMRCDAHPLSLMVFCPGDPQYAVTAESSSGPATSKMYLCLSLLTIGRQEDCAPGTENPNFADPTNTKSELVVFGMSRRVYPNTLVSEWVRFSLFEHSFQALIICTKTSTILTSKAMSETLTFILPHRGSPRASAIVAGNLNVQGPANSKQKALVKPLCGSVKILQL